MAINDSEIESIIDFTDDIAIYLAMTRYYCINKIIGMDIEKAKQFLNRYHYTLVHIQADNKIINSIVTREFRVSRFRVATTNNIIIDVIVG